MLKVDISGFDKLQHTFDEARKALQSLDGEFARIRIDGNDPLETQKAIHKMEVAVDGKLDRYRNNPIIAKLADATKETFRQRILELASSYRNPTSELTSQVQDEEKAVNPAIEMKRKQRFEYMNELYRVTNGNEMAHVGMAEIGGSLGFTDDECSLTVQYLDGEGLLKYVSLDGWIGITHLGVLEVESALQNPEKPTDHFPPAQNIIHIETMTNSVIQQGVANSSQSVAFGSNDTQLIAQFLGVVAACLPSMRLSDEDKNEALSEIATTRAQLDSPKPKTGIIQSSLSTLVSILEKVSAFGPGERDYFPLACHTRPYQLIEVTVLQPIR
jgi:hypothetical protein